MQMTLESPETYVGYGRGQNFASGPPTLDKPANYQTPLPAPAQPVGLYRPLDHRRGERSSLDRPAARSLSASMPVTCIWCWVRPVAAKPVRFKVTLDGQPPGDNHGMDTDADGNGTVTGQRLYQLIRQPNGVADHTFSIQFLDPGVEAYSFTFG